MICRNLYKQLTDANSFPLPGKISFISERMPSPNSVQLKPRSCFVCNQKAELYRCSACRVVYYCGSEHQLADRSNHKQACTVVKKAIAKMDQEEQKLRNMQGDILTPDNLFEEHVGHFWGILETRPYMRQRYAVVDLTLAYFGAAGGEADAVEVSLDHLLDMIRLCRGDNMGVRDLVPFLYIRLGRDQEAYDFLKWYATMGKDSHYDWGNMDLPFLHLKDEDALERPESLWSGKPFIDLAHSVAVTLVKVRILLDLRAILDTSKTLSGTIPQEIIDMICGELVGNIVRSRPELLRKSREDINKLTQAIETQVLDLYQTIKDENPHYFKELFGDPTSLIKDRPNMYSRGTKEEASLILGYSYSAWVETPGAIDAVKETSKKA